MNVLVIKPSSIGDVLHTFPAVDLMRRSLGSDLKITWVVNESLKGVVELCPGVDRILAFPRGNMWNVSAMRAFLRSLRSEKYDVALDFQGLLKSGLIAYFSRSGLRAGFAHAREGAPLFYNRKVRIADMHTHAVEKNLRLVREVFSIQEDVSAEGRPEVKNAFPIPEKYIAVCFSSRWESKNWPPEFLAGVMDRVAEKRPDICFKLVGTAADAPMGEKLLSFVRRASCENMAGKTSFMELAGLLASAEVMFTVDSGPMHLAAAFGTPCVAMFGSTDPVLTGPYGKPGEHGIVLSRCSKSPCFKRKCPMAADCSLGVSAEDAAFEILSRLKE